MKEFDYSLNYKDLDLRKHPELYRIGRGEQGVLLVEPYKSEILPHWKFKTVEIAKKSSGKIYRMFLQYKKNNDFVGMDMARKFLQMGYTRSRRYANHRNGKKYGKNKKEILPQEEDWMNNEKAMAASVFYEKYLLAKNDLKYISMKSLHKQKYEKE